MCWPPRVWNDLGAASVPSICYSICKLTLGETVGRLMQGYIPIEYPKWVDGVVVQNAAEEQAYRSRLADAEQPTLSAEVARHPSPAGIRMRRTRERRREGKVPIRCDISAHHIDALANAGFIDPGMRDDAVEAARGVCRLLDRLTQSGQGPTIWPEGT